MYHIAANPVLPEKGGDDLPVCAAAIDFELAPAHGARPRYGAVAVGGRGG